MGTIPNRWYEGGAEVPGARARLVAEIRDELAVARGQARAASAAAESRRAAAHARLRAVREAHLACLSSLGAQRELTVRRIEERFLASSRALAAAALEASEVDDSLVRVGTVTAPGCGVTLPALVPLLGRGHLWLSGDQSIVDDVLATVLARVMEAAPPGSVRLTVFDPERLGGSLAGFAPLAGADLVRFVGPGGLGAMVDGLVEEIQRVNAIVLASRTSPPTRHLVVVLGDTATAAGLTEAHHAQLDRIVRLGAACGIHLVGRGLPLPDGPAVTRVRVTGGMAYTTAVADLPITLDRAPAEAEVAELCRAVAARALAGPPAASFADLMPPEPWRSSAASGLSAPVGTALDTADLVELSLGDDPPHALIGGPSGSGKTNLIYAWLGSLCARYAPDELALYLLDFKEGVSFARFAPSPRDPSWLPHVRLVGININNDREFGLALLRHLGDELRRRAAAAKRHEATKLSELRAEDPTGSWPRIVAVIDEFQVLLSGRDAVTTEAVTLLEDLARRGRSQGIHLVLASQDVSGIEALWGRSGLVAQFTLRVALPKARRILSDTNLAADTIPRFTAVVNPDSGVPSANRVVRIPDASDRTTWQALRHALWESRPAHLPPPRLFDGDAVPELPTPARAAEPPSAAVTDAVAVAAPPLPHAAAAPPVALLGETIDVLSRPAVFPLTRTPGRNLAVLGTRTHEACAILTAAALSVADGGPRPRFTVVCLDDDALPQAMALHGALPEADWHDRDTVADLVTELARDVRRTAAPTPHVVVGFAWDARPPGTDLKPILTHGPDRRLHVLGWWRTVARLREDLGGPGARTDPIGGWVALDVHGPDLAPLSPQPGGPLWYPRERRALFFDRAAHRTPQVIVPYAIPPSRLTRTTSGPASTSIPHPARPLKTAPANLSRDGSTARSTTAVPPMRSGGLQPPDTPDDAVDGARG